MKQLDPKITEMCKAVRISDYLKNKGVEVTTSGSRWKCKCPLGTHADHDPSFYIRTMPDGADMLKCFGCGKAGNIITLMSIMDKKTKGQTVKDLSSQLGITLGKFDFTAQLDPMPDEVDETFCDEQQIMYEVGKIVVPFLQTHQTPDVINKITRLYKQLEQMVFVANIEGACRYRDLIFKAIEEYV
jgi:DNA primase